MSGSGLHRCLHEKYGISERLLAEGTFVQLAGSSQDAACLVRVGLGERCLVLAAVSFTGDELDYDLMSVTPLPLLHVTYNSRNFKLRMSSRFKSPHVYQLCSCERQAEVWDEFTTAIDAINGSRGEDIWCNTSLSSVASGSSSAEFEWPTSFYDGFFNACSCKYVNGNTKYSRSCMVPRLQNNTVSMTTLPSSEHADEFLRYHVVHGHSVDCLESVQFESFVNQEPSSQKIANLRAHEHSTEVNEDEPETSVKKSCGLFARLRDAVACFKKKR